MRRKIIAFFAIALLLLTCSFTVFAEEFDQSKNGSITITLVEQKEKEPIIGAELSLYYVATAFLDANGNLIYDYTKDFEPLNAALTDKKLAEKLSVFVSEHSVTSQKITTDAKGTALCEELPLGLYFVKQTGAVAGFAPCTPFLVTVPNEMNGEYVYDVNASPKTEVAKLTSITIKKVWNTGASLKKANSVTVQLLQNGNVVKTATLDAKNDWQVTYCDMPESDAYSVREINIPKGFTATYKQNGYVFTVTNTETLIQTGQLIWPIPVLAIIGMLLIAFGIVLLQKKRKTNA